MKLATALTLAAALVAGGISYAGDGDKTDKGGCPAGGCCGADKAKDAKVVELKIEELEKLVAEKKATIVDVNPAERFAKSHVPGARNMKADELDAKQLPSDKGAQLVFYCASEKCHACEKAAAKAIELGYTKVAVYRGGIAGWEGAKQTVETGAKASS